MLEDMSCWTSDTIDPINIKLPSGKLSYGEKHARIQAVGTISFRMIIGRGPVFIHRGYGPMVRVCASRIHNTIKEPKYEV
jgi:hypothetical protein